MADAEINSERPVYGLILFGFAWTVIAIVAATTSYIALGGSSIHEWLRIFGYMASYFYVWAAISIAINWLILRTSNLHLSLALAIHLVLLLAIGVSLPFLLHPGNWESWLYGERAVGFHSLNALIYSFVLIASMMVRYFRASRASEAAAHAAALRQIELERSLQESRMEALRAQINPHFLFNALNSIASLVESESNQEAYELIARISELLRRALDISRDSLVTIDEEIRFLSAYLDIEKVRYGSRLLVSQAIAEECRTCDVPSFSLQPLVENVVKHAVAKSSNAVTIEISVSRSDNDVVLCVSDDGPGLKLPLQFGVGLSNIRERIHFLFGDGASLQVRNRERGGAEIMLRVPARETISKASVPAAKQADRPQSSTLAHAPN